MTRHVVPGPAGAGMPAGRWTLRPASALDLSEATRVLKAAGLPDDELETQFGEAYAVATRDGRIEGLAGLEIYGSHGFLRSVAVLPEARGSGLGRALVQDRLERARRLGLEDVSLLTMNASGYFERLGFRVAPRSTAPEAVRKSCQFTTACPDSAIFMTLAIPRSP